MFHSVLILSPSLASRRTHSAPQVQGEGELAAAWLANGGLGHLHGAWRMPLPEESRQAPAFGLVGIDRVGHIIATAWVRHVVLAAPE